MAARVLAPLGRQRTGRQAAFLLSALPLGTVWLAALVAGWSIVISVAITPLVVPAVLGLALLVNGCAAVEAAIGRNLLGDSIVRPQRAPAAGFWRRAWNIVADPWLWKAQAYLALRMSVGFVLAVALLALGGSAVGLITAPAWFWAIPEGLDVGLYRVHTFAQSLPLVPAGAILLLALAWAMAPLATPWRTLASYLLGGEDQVVQAVRLEKERDRGVDRSVEIHAIVVGSLSVLLIAIWAITSRTYFWPMWAILALVAPLAIHAWVLEAGRLGPYWREHRLDTGFAIHAGVWVVVILFLIGVWAASGGGYFWPVWVLFPAVIALGAQFTASRMGAREALTERISTLETSRAGAVDVQEAELRRIERDLHDGAQARLVALGMSLGMAEQKLAEQGDGDADAARELLAEARAGAGEALKELRALARGIHPPVLADRGLDAAVRALAATSPLAVTVSVMIPERPRAPVESAAYFVVAEALANAGKHAHANRIDVRIAQIGDTLSVEVHDDGVGGADANGGGLSGLRRRVQALDGSLAVLSPPGGPTTIRAELPCGS
jgi:signal transduction histidine kinase